MVDETGRGGVGRVPRAVFLVPLGPPSSQPFRPMKVCPTALRNGPLDDPPPGREITIPRWRGPEGVHMIGQQHPRIDHEGILDAN